MIYSKILSTGSYLPERVMTNSELATKIDTSDEWIRTRTGIEQRHIALSDESSNDLAYKAAFCAIERGNIDPATLDLIIVATSTPEHIFPGNATQLQTRLGCRDIAAFDIQAACSGFIFALATADNFIRSGSVKRALVVGAELFSNIINWKDRGTAILFGDGAGAVIIESGDTPGIHGSVLHSDGRYKDLLLVPCGSGSPANEIRNRLPFIHMEGREVFKVAVRSLAKVVDELLLQHNMTTDNIDFLIPHQANLRIIKATAEHLNLSMEKVIVTVDCHANTSAASIPLALDHGIQTGKIYRGNKLLLEAFGGGFTWGGSIITY